MAKVLEGAKVDPSSGCQHVIRSDTEEEILKKAADQAFLHLKLPFENPRWRDQKIPIQGGMPARSGKIKHLSCRTTYDCVTFL
jgi:hypothetical protein